MYWLRLLHTEYFLEWQTIENKTAAPLIQLLFPQTQHSRVQNDLMLA